jgi:glutamate 5-kinase
MQKKIVVIKVGSNVVAPHGKVSLIVLQSLAQQVACARTQGYAVIIVSSGAVSCGKKFVMGMDDMAFYQAAAAVGQPILMKHWADAFAEYNITVGQFLETHEAFENPDVVALLRTSLKYGIIPIINENDVMSSEEMRQLQKCGDNDKLAAIVAIKLQAAALILLTNVDGLYASVEDIQARKVIACIPEINEDILALANLLNSGRPTGMRPKLLAARQVTEQGIPVWIANGFTPDIVPKILAGEPVGTHCLPR